MLQLNFNNNLVIINCKRQHTMRTSASTDINTSSTEHQNHIKNFVPLGIIGHGSFSEVHKVRRISDGKIYALKRIKLPSLKPKQQEYAISEIKILAALSCPYIISFRQSFYDPLLKQLCIVMEWANQGDLQSDIERRKKSMQAGSRDRGKEPTLIRRQRIPESQIWRAIRDILSGLAVLHDTSILHRDIKTANIFKCEGVYKLGDLNIAKICPGLAYAYTQTGTPYYASPQVWKQLPYNTKSDIWSFGCVIYEMCELSPPFVGTDMNNLYENVIRGKYRPIDRNFYSKQLAELIENCLKIDPKERKSCRQILSSKEFKFKMEQYNIKEDLESARESHVHAGPQNVQSTKQMDQKELNIKLTKELRQYRSITEPAIDPTSPYLEKHPKNTNLSRYSSNQLNEILPTSNYPSQITKKKVNKSQCYEINSLQIRKEDKKTQPRPVSCRSQMSDTKKNDKENKLETKQSGLAGIPLSESLIADKKYPLTIPEQKQKRRVLIIPPKIKGINPIPKLYEKSRTENKLPLHNVSIGNEREIMDKYSEMAKNAVKQLTHQNNSEKKYKYKYKYKYEYNGIRPSSHNPNRKRFKQEQNSETYQKGLYNIGSLNRPTSAQAQYRVRRYQHQQPRQARKQPYKLPEPNNKNLSTQKILKPSSKIYNKMQTSNESVHDLPKIRHMLANRNSNIRQQIGKIYYNYHNLSYNGYQNGVPGRNGCYFG